MRRWRCCSHETAASALGSLKNVDVPRGSLFARIQRGVCEAIEFGRVAFILLILKGSGDQDHQCPPVELLFLWRIVTASSIRILASQLRKAPSCSNRGARSEASRKQFCTASSASS